MAAGRSGERESLGIFAKTQSKYGSTKISQPRNETYIQHKVLETDTMQGISLKYGVTMENIKRVNKIWTNDSLHLRDTLLIPVLHSPTESGSFINGDTFSPVRSPPHLLSPVGANGDSAQFQTRTNEKSQNGEKETHSDKKESAKDFLSKYDSSLASIRTNVKKMEKGAEFLDDSSNPLNLLPPKKTSKYLQRPRTETLDTMSDSSITSSPELVIKARVRNQQIKSSMVRMEEQQDSLFQL